jgi:hypothetical protein
MTLTSNGLAIERVGCLVTRFRRVHATYADIQVVR